MSACCFDICNQAVTAANSRIYALTLPKDLDNLQLAYCLVDSLVLCTFVLIFVADVFLPLKCLVA
jgi:hypothetical protein